MNAVRPFPIPDPIPGTVSINMPIGASVLSAEVVVAGLSTITIFALCDDALPRVDRVFEVIETNYLTSAMGSEFIGTVISPAGTQYHVFERGSC